MSKKREHHKLFMVGSDAPFQFTEAYKSLRTNLEFLAATSDCKTILITSSVPGEGKSNVAVNLAITLADSGKRVVLVDCDMRKSTISRYLHIPRDHIALPTPLRARTVPNWPMHWSTSKTWALWCYLLAPSPRTHRNCWQRRRWKIPLRP